MTRPVNITNIPSSNPLVQKSLWNQKTVSNITNSVKSGRQKVEKVMQKVENMIRIAQLIMAVFAIIIVIVGATLMGIEAWNNRSKPPVDPDIGSWEYFVKIMRQEQRRKQEAQANSFPNNQFEPQIKKYLEQREKLMTELAQKTNEKERYELAEKILYDDVDNNLFDKAAEIIKSKYFNPKAQNGALEALESVKQIRIAEAKLKTETQDQYISQEQTSKIRVTYNQYNQALDIIVKETKTSLIEIKNLSISEFKIMQKQWVRRLHPDKGGALDQIQNFNDACDKIKAYNNWT